MASEKSSLTFEKLHEAVVSRWEATYKPIEDWSPSDYSNAMAGECGEACNFIKKMRKGEKIKKKKIAHELSDIICCVELLATRLGIDLEKAVIDKFNKVSKKKKSNITL